MLQDNKFMKKAKILIMIITQILVFRQDLKVCWFAITRACLFKCTWPIGKKSYHFEMKKIALILIYNMLVAKFFFSGMNIKKNFDSHVSSRPGWVTINQHIFKSDLSYGISKYDTSSANTMADKLDNKSL